MPDPIVTTWLRDTRDWMRELHRDGVRDERRADMLAEHIATMREDEDATPERLEEYLTGIFWALAPCDLCHDEGTIVGDVDVWRGSPGGGYHTTERHRMECPACDDRRWY